MEKIGEGSYVMSIDEFMDLICGDDEPDCSDDEHNDLEGAKPEIKLETTNIKLLMLAHSIIVHNLMFDKLDKEQADLLMRFSEILVKNAKEIFAAETENREEETKNVRMS